MTKSEYERSIGFLVHDVARLMRVTFDRSVRDAGLTRAQWFVLAYIIRTDGQTQTELAEETDMEKAPLGKLLDRLQDGGWIERRLDPKDRRVKRVFKTAKVDPLTDVMSDATDRLYEIAFDGLDVDVRTHLVDGLIHLKKNLVAHKDG